MENELSLNPADVDNMTRAVRLASKRGAFEMEETAQLLASVTRLEQWVKTVRLAQEEAASAAESEVATSPKQKQKGKT